MRYQMVNSIQNVNIFHTTILPNFHSYLRTRIPYTCGGPNIFCKMGLMEYPTFTNFLWYASKPVLYHHALRFIIRINISLDKYCQYTGKIKQKKLISAQWTTNQDNGLPQKLIISFGRKNIKITKRHQQTIFIIHPPWCKLSRGSF